MDIKNDFASWLRNRTANQFYEGETLDIKFIKYLASKELEILNNLVKVKSITSKQKEQAIEQKRNNRF